MNTEIKLPVAELKEALPGLNKVIGKSRSLPVLQSVRINRNREGVITLQASDLETFLTYTARTAQQGEPAEVLVPVDQLTKALKCSSPKEDIGLVPEAKDKVKLRYNIAGNTVEQTISTLPVEEYPAAPHVRQPGVQVEPQFGRALKEALECSSEDSSRRVISGACLDVEDKKYHYIVGTNGRVLFSANSFCFTLPKSVIIPNSKFLSWSDFMAEEPCFLSVEPGKEQEQAGWVKIESPRWTYVARQIDGQFPKWKQVLPTGTDKWTRIDLSEEAIKQLVQVTPQLPGDYGPNFPVRLRVDGCLFIEGRNKDGEQWTSIPVQNVTVTGKPVSVGLNRDYLLKGLRFGLNRLEVQDGLAPVLFTKGGKRLVIMPINLGEADPAPAATTPESTQVPEAAPEPAPAPVQPEAPAEKEAPKVTKAPEVVSNDTQVAQNQTGNGNGNGSAIKALVEQVETIKDNLRSVIRDLSAVVDMVKMAEKEKRATEKEIEVIRSKLRQIQSVTI